MSEAPSLSIGLAFAAGVASFLSPCVLPLVPSYISFVTGMTLDDLATGGGGGGGDRVGAAPWRAAAHATLFVAGFSLVFIALGATATVLGVVIRRALPALQVVGGVVIMAFGLHMVGLLSIPGLLREQRAHLAAKPAGLVGSVTVGVAFGAGWTPCIGPVLASILLYAGMTATVARGVLLLAAYTVGLGVPFLLAAVSFHWYLSRARRVTPWLPVIERMAGATLFVMGALLASGRFTMLSTFFAGFGQLIRVQ
ncbi:MAG: cytochrome c biogenesis protein CcdA [Gemmatimonadaceae bacterium]